MSCWLEVSKSRKALVALPSQGVPHKPYWVHNAGKKGHPSLDHGAEAFTLRRGEIVKNARLMVPPPLQGESLLIRVVYGGDNFS